MKKKVAKKKKDAKHEAACKLVATYFSSNGTMRSLPIGSQHKNGPDVTMVSKNKVFTIEVKTLSRKVSGSWQAKAVEKTRKNDDFVAVVHLDVILLVDTMKAYLSACTKSGCRSFTKTVEFLNATYE